MFQGEKVVETKICKLCNSSFDITDKDLEFYEKISPIFANPGVEKETPGLKINPDGKLKYLIPTPTLCPDCRQQRRLAWRNERKLYKRKCDLSGKEIISIYSPIPPYKIYETKEWWSDKWNALDYEKDYDFSKPFFKQFNDLMIKVPRLSILNSKGENSEFCNNSIGEKNCYLSFVAGYNEDSAYLHFLGYTKNCYDLLWGWANENCYETIKTTKCYNLKYSINCLECSNSIYLTDCTGVKDSSFCIGLTNKQYNFLNKKYSKEEYIIIEEKLKNDLKFLSDNKQKYIDLLEKFPRKNLKNNQGENILGDNINFSKNCFYCFDCDQGENLKYSYDSFNISNMYDGYLCGTTYDAKKSEKVYESENLVNTYGVYCSSTVWDGSNMYYCDNCFNCENCFGCVGLKYKKYCILNKQYSKKEYEELVPKVIEHMEKTGEWGEFFPSSISPFGYNETLANEYFPLKKEDAIKKGFNWSDYEVPLAKVEKIIPASKLPLNISDIPDDILNWAVECEISKKPFKIIKQELEFYRKHNLPIPRRHPDQRHLDRMALRNPRILYDRKCEKCGIDIKTTYAPDRSEVVYCEECYNKEIY